MARLTMPATGGRPKHVYLAGAIEHSPDQGRKWRQEMAHFVERELGMTVFNPCVNEVALLSEEENRCFREWKQSDRTRFLPVIHRIIDHDLQQLLEHTAFIICLWDEYVLRGAGTAGELTLAYHRDIPVYMVRAVPAEALSSWAAGCATEVFADFEELKRHLLAQREATAAR